MMNEHPQLPPYVAGRTGRRERFELELHDICEAGGRVVTTAPIVDGWLQLDCRVVRPPDVAEERAFFAALVALRAARGAGYWFFLHKTPGLRLRFKLGADRPAEIDTILAHVRSWRAGWLGEIAFGSYFSQAELLDERFRDVADALLTTAADELIDATLARGRHAGIDVWAAFSLDFVEHFIADRWFAWEALGRFERFRSRHLTGGEGAACPTDASEFSDPSAILARFGRRGVIAPAGFGASVALLQTLNYLFNMWAVDGAAQNAALARARARSVPELLAQ